MASPHRAATRLASLALLAAGLTTGCPSDRPGAYLLDLSGGMDGTGDGAGGDGLADAGQPPAGLCEPCAAGSPCPGACVEVDGTRLCLATCEEGACPGGLTCRDLDAGAFCVPPDGVCPCAAEQAGETRACETVADAGTCTGAATCDPATGWLCDAAAPAAELCDHLDNDCDGVADEDFLLGTWYFGAENCGDCGVRCEVEHGQAFCSLTTPPPVCRVSACDPGYVSQDGLSCVPAGGLACVPCLDDGDCAGGTCSPLEGASFCFPPCPPGCLEGYQCVTDGLPSDTGLCEPISGSCDCGPDTVGQPRGCQVTNASGTCLGQELCTPAGWGPCDAPTPLPEECNGLDENCNGLLDEGLPEDEPCVSSVPGVGSCAGVLLCLGPAGWTCTAETPQPEACDNADNDCDGVVDDGFRDPATGLYTGDTDCGFCGNDCTLLVFPHAAGVCIVDGGVPACGMACEAGWVDANGTVEDGCECPFLGPEDPPDGVDQNCDGIDGDPANAIFVSVTGSDTSPGTPEQPVRTVEKGLERAENASKGHVYVTGGDFPGGARLREGVRVFCGFALDFSQRDVATHESVLLPGTLTPAAPGTVNAVAVGLGAKITSLEGCTVTGPVVSAPGAAAITVYVRDAGPGLHLADNLLLGGSGGPGVAGTAGDHGQDGVAGAAGQWAYDVGFQNLCTAANAQPGGGGGSMSCGAAAVSGGAGGAAVCPDYDEWGPVNGCPVEEHQSPGAAESGTAGLPTGKGGAGGYPGLDAIHTVMDNGMFCGWDSMNCSYCHVALGGSGGQNGKNGVAGTNGAAGSGCTQKGGAVTGGTWVPSTGGGGGAGTWGGGGGGGGAAGGVEVYGCEEFSQGSDVGGSGGGGGSGGCGGTGGTGGGGGGAALTLFLTWGSTFPGFPQLTGNTLVTGTAGAGAAGGAGGVGGTGGYGGDGGVDGGGDYSLWCVGEGGNGGHGGTGGAGGGGGGGCGGPAVAIVVHGPAAAAAPAQAALAAGTVTLSGTPGAAGPGGTSKGNAGLAGAPGLHQALHILSN